MEALLTVWLEGVEPLLVADEASVSLVRQRVRAEAAEAGLDREQAERLVLCASELARNVLRHAGRGWMGVRPLRLAGGRGLEVIAADRGPGLADPTAALRGRSAPAGSLSDSLGAGLAAVLRQADEVDFDIRWQEGMCVRARKFAVPPRMRCEVAVLGRPTWEEQESGDDALLVRGDEALLLAVADGLGHGRGAQEAAFRAVEVVRHNPLLPPDALLHACDQALRGSRGAVLGLVRIDRWRGELLHACRGNITTGVWEQGRMRSFVCSRAVLGLPHPHLRERLDRVPAHPGQVLVMHTDGLSSRTAIDDPLLAHQHPLLVAHALLQRFARPDDDALVLVARLR